MPEAGELRDDERRLRLLRGQRPERRDLQERLHHQADAVVHAAGGLLLQVEAEEPHQAGDPESDDGDPKLVSVRGYEEPVVAPAAPETAVRADGAALAVLRPLEGTWDCTVDAIRVIEPGC